jgi:hypothetical protein
MAYKQLDILFGAAETGLTGGPMDLSLTATAGFPPASITAIAANFLQVADGFSLDIQNEMTAQKFATGFFDQHASIPGTISAEAKITTYLQSGGKNGGDPNTPDSFGKYLSACGLKCTLGTGTPTFYVPSSDYADDWNPMTLWKYTGDTTSSGSNLYQANGVLFNGVLKGEIGKPFQLDLTGKGAVNALPYVATYPAGPFTQLSDLNPAVMKASPITLLGAFYRALSFEFDFGNKVELIKDMTATYGFVRADITDRASKWKLKIYEAATVDGGESSNLYSAMQAQSSFDISFYFALTTGYGITIATGTNTTAPMASNAAQLTKIVPGNENGVNTWELEGIIIGNNWSLQTSV